MRLITTLIKVFTLFSLILNSSCGLVSVVMPSFNRGKYMKESIACLQNQTYQNWELIIVDNGSADKETQDVIEQIQNGVIQDQRIRAFKLNSDYGIGSVPRNFGIGKAKGDYITFLDDDDLMSYDRLRTAVEIFEANKEIDMVICDITTIDEYGNLIRREISKPVDQDLLKFIQLFQFAIHFQATVIRNDRLKPYIYNIPMVSQDREQFHRLSYVHNAKIARVTEYQGAYRRHPKQITRVMAVNQHMANPDKIVKKVFLPIAFPDVFGPTPYYLYRDEQIIYDDFYVTPNQTEYTSADKDAYQLTQAETPEDLERLLHHREVIENLLEDFSCLIQQFAIKEHNDTNSGCYIENLKQLNDHLDKFDKHFASRNTSAAMLRFFQQLRRVVREGEQQFNGNIDEIEQSIYFDQQINKYTCLTPENYNAKVTIIAHITKDGEQIKKAIKSVQQQSLKNWELLIIDSQSKDMETSRQVIRQFMENDKRIKLIRSLDNLEHEIQNGYVAFFNLQGEMPLYRLCIQANYLHFNSHVDVVGGGFEDQRQPSDQVISYWQLRLRQLFGNHISSSSILMKSKYIDCISDYASGSVSQYDILYKMMFERSLYFEVLDQQMVLLPEDSQEYKQLKQNRISDPNTRTKLLNFFKKEYSPIDTYPEQDRNMSLIYDSLECLLHSTEAISCTREMKELFNIYFKQYGLFQGEATVDQYNHAHSILKVVDLLSRRNNLIDMWTILYEHSSYVERYRFEIEVGFESKIVEEVLDILLV
eukprot:403373918